MNDREDADRINSDHWLERMLADDAREHRADYLADDGFTAKAMQALPAPATLPAWRKPVLVLLWALALLGAAGMVPELGAEVAREVMRIVAAYPVSLSGIATGIVALAAATWAAAALVLRNDT